MERIGWNEYFMNITVQVSLRSTCLRRKVGAVITKNNVIISTGYNGSPKGLPNCSDDSSRCYRSANNIPSGEKLDLCFAQHAEINALMYALKSGENLEGASIYVTTFPCSSCAKAIMQAGIKNVYFLDEYASEFTVKMFDEAGIYYESLDSSIYNTPSLPNAEIKTANDLDCIDPLVKEIYKYVPGTEKFIENRKRLFNERGLWDRYDENIYATKLKTYKEIVEVDTEDYQIFKDMAMFPMNRNELEYNGDSIKQVVVGAILYQPEYNLFAFLESIDGRLKGKLTMIQGHANADVDGPILQALNYNMGKEIYEELVISTKVKLEPKFVIQTNDNKISSEHIGVIYLASIDDPEHFRTLTSGEPDKHNVVIMSRRDAMKEENLNRMDTWLRKIMTEI